MTKDSPIYCGVAGWSYPDWEGFVYPPRTADKLQYISAYVDCIEINSSFYRPPSSHVAEGWVRKTAARPDFFFTAKLHRDITHGGRIEPSMKQAFRDGLQPLRDAGKLRHLLAQFRYDFADSPAAREHLAAIRDHFGDLCNLTLELRHNSWQAPRTLEFLTSLGVTVANLDYPTSRDSFNLHLCTVGENAYFRLHGRNADAWFGKSGRDETYNYLYSEEELHEIVSRARQIGAMSKSLTLIANNHYQGKEAVNILQVKAALTGGTVPIPAPLAEKYPKLKDVAEQAVTVPSSHRGAS